jgi:hypothetical protein
MSSATEAKLIHVAVESLIDHVRDSPDLPDILARTSSSLVTKGTFIRQLHEDVKTFAEALHRNCKRKKLGVTSKPDAEFGTIAAAALMVLQPLVYERCVTTVRSAPGSKRLSTRKFNLKNVAVLDLNEVALFVGRARTAQIEVVLRADEHVKGARPDAPLPQPPAQSDTDSALAAALEDAVATHGAAPDDGPRTRGRTSGLRGRDASGLSLFQTLAPVLVAAPPPLQPTDGHAAGGPIPTVVDGPPMDDGDDELYLGEGSWFAVPFSSAAARAHSSTEGSEPAAKQHRSETATAGAAPGGTGPRADRLACVVCGLVARISSGDGPEGSQQAQDKSASGRALAARRKKATEFLASRDATRRHQLYQCSRCGTAVHRACIQPPRFDLPHPFVCTVCLMVDAMAQPVCPCEPILT